MPCIEHRSGRPCAARHGPSLRLTGLAGVVVLCLAGCGSRPLPPPAPAGPAGPAAPMPGAAPASPTAAPASPSGPGARLGTPAVPLPAPGTQLPGGSPALPMGGRVRNWEEYRQQAARRMVAAHPGGTYMGRVPEPLLAIPVLEVELQADGHVREIRVLRQPGQARDTVQLAMEAVRRAAPFGPVAHLPRPWRFTEAFLFDDARRFKPRSLD